MSIAQIVTAIIQAAEYEDHVAYGDSDGNVVVFTARVSRAFAMRFATQVG